LLATLRREFESRWAEAVAAPWAERHAEVRRQRERLAALRAQAELDADEQLEQLRLTLRLEPEVDLRAPLAAFNAAHPDHPLALFLEGSVRLDRGEREGIALLERAMALDPEATKAVCERVHAFLAEQKDDAAERWAERWRERDAMETERGRQLASLGPRDTLAAHGLDAAQVAALKQCLTRDAMQHVAEVYVARRVIAADASVVQHVMGVRLTWWGRQRGRQQAVVDRLAALEWPLPLVFFTLDPPYAPLRKKLRALPDARLI
jgi:hypothetical protein